MQSLTGEIGIKLRLAANEHWLPVVLENISDGAIATDPHGRVMLMNHVAEALTGWGLEDAWDRELTEVFNLADAQGSDADVEGSATKALCEGRVVRLASYSILISKDGTQTPVGGRVVPIRHDKGNATGVLLFFHRLR